MNTLVRNLLLCAGIGLALQLWLGLYERHVPLVLDPGTLACTAPAADATRGALTGEAMAGAGHDDALVFVSVELIEPVPGSPSADTIAR